MKYHRVEFTAKEASGKEFSLHFDASRSAPRVSVIKAIEQCQKRLFEADRTHRCATIGSDVLDGAADPQLIYLAFLASFEPKE